MDYIQFLHTCTKEQAWETLGYVMQRRVYFPRELFDYLWGIYKGENVSLPLHKLDTWEGIRELSYDLAESDINIEEMRKPIEYNWDFYSIIHDTSEPTGHELMDALNELIAIIEREQEIGDRIQAYARLGII